MTRQTVYLDFITHVGESSYRLEGYIGGLLDPTIYRTKVVINNREYSLTFTNRIQSQEFLELDNPIKNSTFETIVELPEAPAKIRFISKKGQLAVKANRFTGMSRLLYSSRIIGAHQFTVTRQLSSKGSEYAHSGISEFLKILSIVVNWRLLDVYRKLLLSRSSENISLKKELCKAPLVIIEAVIKIPYSLALRAAYYSTRSKYSSKPVWLMSDRAMAAGDNGEALFRYIVNLDNCPYDVYFVLSRSSADYSRVKSISHAVLEPGSWRHKLLMLHAQMVVSSQADTETINPYLRQLNHVVDLVKYKFVFLQHGVIRHDLSRWLNRFNRNISLFITTSSMEYKSILSNNYYYAKDQVLLSGLPRYDLLKSEPMRKLILAPTYRNNILTKKTNRLGQRSYDPDFRKSEYYSFYNNLMNDSKVLATMKEHNMIGELYLHPVFEKQRIDFDENSLFKVMEYPYDYKKAFCEGSMLISDHSSVVFDFAYLKKPVLYAYFDVDTFFNGHSYDKSNFFSDEKNGFGDVCYDYASLVDKTIKLIENGCIMAPKYRHRVDDYFYNNDRNNSERVYNAILDIIDG